MKLIIRLLFIIAFILNFGLSVFSKGTLEINSVVFDNSDSVLLLNSFSLDDFEYNTSPKLNIDPDENKAYVDIESAILHGQMQNLVLDNSDIKQITVSQLSTDPSVVRVAFSYDEKFNPTNVKLKRLNNTLFLEFKKTSSSNFYFNPIYYESKIQELFEPVNIQIPVEAKGDAINQINSAFNQTAEKNYVMVKKNQILKSKYFINSININNRNLEISGVGAYTISKPIYLSNPNRAVFDFPNSIVNPSVRNKIYNFGQDESVKIGQFDKNTARLVITTSNPAEYMPVFHPDSQKIIFINRNIQSINNSYPHTIDINNVQIEKSGTNIQGIKFVFSGQVLFGVVKSKIENAEFNELILYNVGKHTQELIKSKLKSSAFSGFEIKNLKNDGYVIKFPAKNKDKVDIYLGADGKTLRFRQTFSSNIVKEEKDSAINSTPAANRVAGKRYVVIDPGHGGSDCGAIRNNINEKDITLDISKRVEKLLKDKGYVVEMTRTTDQTVSLQERVDISENFYPDIFVSIHVNSSNSESPSGLETHYYKENSLLLAKFVHASMLNNIDSNDRGLFKSKFYVINHTTAPAILVETGFLSNPKERAQIVTESRKNNTAKAIAEGIDEYFKKY